MNSTFKRVFLEWKKLPDFFWGDPFDFRFFNALELEKLKAKRVLDIGCSVGVNVNTVDASQRIGIDINIDSLKKGKKVYPKTEFVSASANCLPFRSDSFDFIISIHTLDTDPLVPELAIKEISRVIEKRGKIFLTGNWYHAEYMSKFTSTLRVSGSWIEKLKEEFDLDIKWYVRPNLKKIGLKIKRNMLKKFPEYFLKIINMDDELKKMYKESLKPLEMEPYIVKGTRK